MIISVGNTVVQATPFIHDLCLAMRSAGIGLTEAHIRMALLMAFVREEPITMVQLARDVGLGRATVGTYLQSMIRAGEAERVADGYLLTVIGFNGYLRFAERMQSKMPDRCRESLKLIRNSGLYEKSVKG